jgi:hypothetical protein
VENSASLPRPGDHIAKRNAIPWPVEMNNEQNSSHGSFGENGFPMAVRAE